jgi:YbgC/YbaW family acyl-CoA thioester hydrolase
MSKVFTRTFRVRWGELDPSGTVSPANYLRYLIETAWDFGDSLGLGANASQDLDLFWLIRDTEIRFLRPLRQNDVFDFALWLVNWQKVAVHVVLNLLLKRTAL